MTALRPGCRATGTPAPLNCLPRAHAGVNGMTPDLHYEIRVLGSLNGHWRLVRGPASQQRRQPDGPSGSVADQAALPGLLNKVCGLGLVLISVRRPDRD